MRKTGAQAKAKTKKRMDIFSKKKRSYVMSRIRSKDTKPEIIVGKLLWAAGFRYRKHNRKLPGTPDFSNTSKQTVVFVDSCFWHGCKRHYREPKSNRAFWKNKIATNMARDRKITRQYRRMGWNILKIWEHDVSTKKATEKFLPKLGLFLQSRR